MSKMKYFIIIFYVITLFGCKSIFTDENLDINSFIVTGTTSASSDGVIPINSKVDGDFGAFSISWDVDSGDFRGQKDCYNTQLYLSSFLPAQKPVVTAFIDSDYALIYDFRPLNFNRVNSTTSRTTRGGDEICLKAVNLDCKFTNTNEIVCKTRSGEGSKDFSREITIFVGEVPKKAFITLEVRKDFFTKEQKSIPIEFQ